MVCVHYFDKYKNYLNLTVSYSTYVGKDSCSMLLVNPLNFRHMIVEASDYIPKEKDEALYSFPKS